MGRLRSVALFSVAAVLTVSGASAELGTNSVTIDASVAHQAPNAAGPSAAARFRTPSRQQTEPADVTLPPIFDTVAFFIQESAEFQENFPAGSMVFATTSTDGPRSLETMVKNFPPAGIGSVPNAYRPDIRAAVSALSISSLTGKARFVTPHAADLKNLVWELAQGQDGLNGVIVQTSTDPIKVTFSRLHGRCLLASAGEIEVGDITLENGGNDSLVIVSGQRIVVTGKHVDAALVAVEDRTTGVSFAQVATVRGPVLTAQFPRRLGISPTELAACTVGAPAR